jgi:hypothetical protein
MSTQLVAQEAFDMYKSGLSYDRLWIEVSRLHSLSHPQWIEVKSEFSVLFAAQLQSIA